MKIKFFHVDAFTDQPFGGNPAGVVPDANGLSDAEMQNIAKELNLSETAFILPSTNESADYRVRYFTPSSEIDFCGHATLSLVWILATEYRWMDRASMVELETNIGIVPVNWTVEDGKVSTIMMTQVAPRVKEFPIEAETISRVVGISMEDIDERFLVKLGYTGNWHLLVPVKTRRAIDQAKPSLKDLKELNVKHNATTTHLFTFDSEDAELMLYTRDFAPAVGIPEDPVTGSANGALAGYLVLEGILDYKEPQQFTIGQGHSIGRPGFLDVLVIPGEEGPVIMVGGKAVTVIEGTFKL